MEALQLSGRILSSGGGKYEVHLKFEFAAEKRVATLSYGGKPPESALANLLDEIERLPTLQTPPNGVSIELWFRIRA